MLSFIKEFYSIIQSFVEKQNINYKYFSFENAYIFNLTNVNYYSFSKIRIKVV